jgi:hypothetical protein
MFQALYRTDQAKASQEDLCDMRDDALACLSTGEHYLLMLGSVLEDRTVNACLSEEHAPYPVYMTSAEATDGR